MENKPKKNRRSKTKFPGLDPSVNLPSRQEEIHVDYLNKLNEHDKIFLNSFNEEWVNSNFNHAGPTLHKGKKQRKLCYDRNNARNRCIYSKANTTRTLDFIEDMKKSTGYESSTEDLEPVEQLDDSKNDASNGSD